MSVDELVVIIYRYSKSICWKTSLDYRDVAHIAIVQHLNRFRENKIRHVKTYMYLAISCITTNMLRQIARQRHVDYDIGNCGVNCDFESRTEIENICKVLNAKECFIVRHVLFGYSRIEIANMLGTTRANVNLIWFRMIQRLRGIN
jgi:DNA-directed RNA polymerase specialized sigma24 family protein